nr:DUF559 domain-containing protein [Microbacterium ulmi]
MRAAGCTSRGLRASVASGELLRPRLGTYALPGTSDLAMRALGVGGLLACVSAARSLGLWTLDDGEGSNPHVWIAPTRNTSREVLDGCRIHRDTLIDPPRGPSVGIVDVLRQLLRCHGIETFFTALESALRQGILGRRASERLRRAIPREHRWLVDFARSDADSGLESLLRLRLHAIGMTLAPQVEIPGVGRVDFVVGDCLILETDGATHEGAGRHRDLVRDAVAMSLGFITLRFDYAMIVHEWELVELAVVGALARNRHRSDLGLRIEAEAARKRRS